MGCVCTERGAVSCTICSTPQVKNWGQEADTVDVGTLVHDLEASTIGVVVEVEPEGD